MKIGIIVYSQTGTTMKVCEELKNSLEASSHSVAIERIELPADQLHKPGARLSNAPDVNGYEAVILASPVQGFSLARPMQTYLKTQAGMKGKRTAFVLTKALPFKWTGGNQALTAMRQLSKAAGADIIPGGIIIRADENTLNASAAAAAEELKKHL